MLCMLKYLEATKNMKFNNVREVNMLPLISVIVPVYNVEEFLPRCMNSLLRQTYRNLEIILVDDGSTDNCSSLCDEFAKQDKRIKVIHKTNGGLSDARNAGMKVMTGEYVSFIDSDDWINIHFYEVLMDVMKKEDCDIVQCEREILYEEKGEFGSDIADYNVETYEAKEALELLIEEKRFKQVVWNKLYKRENIRLEFAKGKTNEDEFWTYRIFGEADKIAYVNVPMYYYFQREGSIINSLYSLKRLHAIEALVERYQYMQDRYPALTDKAAFSVYCACLYAYQMSIKYLDKNDKRKACEYIKNVVKEFYPSKKILSETSVTMRVWAGCSKLSFDMTCRLRCLLNIGF